MKRMYTRPEIRGQRIGVALLDAITELARQKGVAHLVLETGDVEGFEPAHRLYSKAGFTRCGAFLDYPESKYSAFFEKMARPACRGVSQYGRRPVGQCCAKRNSPIGTAVDIPASFPRACLDRPDPPHPCRRP